MNTSNSVKGTLTSVCDSTNALDATIACHFSEYCILDPVYDLESGSSYSICLTTGIKYANGTSFEGYQATFTAGSGSSSASITSAVDGSENDLSTTTEGINPTSFDLTFSTEMDETSLTTEGNVTFTCTLPSGSSKSQPTVSVAASESAENTYTVSVTDAYMYQLLSCVLTVTTNVTDSNGTALSEAIAYDFTNSCAVGDDFNADSQSCWSVVPTIEGEAAAWSTWDALLNTSTGILTFNASESALVYSSEGKETEGMAIVYKEATPSADGFSFTVKFMGLQSRGSADETDTAIFGLIKGNPLTIEDPGKDATWIGVLASESEGGSLSCTVMYNEGDESEAWADQDCDSYDTFYVRMRFDGSTFYAEYSTDGSNFSTIDGDTEGTFPTDFSGFDHVWFLMETAEENPDTIFNFDYMDVSGITSTDQY